MSEDTSILWFCVVILGVDVVVLAKAYRRLLRKGYRSPLHYFAVVLPTPVLAAACAYWLLPRGPSGTDPTAIAIGTYVVMPSLCAALATLAVVRAMPAKPLRTFGARRTVVNWEMATLLVFAVGTLLVVYVGVRAKLGLWLTVGLWAGSVLGLTFVCLNLAMRAAQPTLEEVTQTDPRPPVLYLRAFGREMATFVELTMSEVESYPPAHDFRPSSKRFGATFEEYFARAITQAQGPFAALGSPEDYLPPQGAARTYANDTGWKDEFEALARRAAWIVMEADLSDDLQWELRRLRETGLHTRLFVFTRPRRKEGLRHVRNWAGRRIERLTSGQGLEPVAWSAFAAGLVEAGYTVDDADPGPGAVITFEDDGRATVLRSGAHTPDDFLDAVEARMETPLLADASALPPAPAGEPAVEEPAKG